MLTRVLAMELAEQRINVNCIAPGYITVDRGTSPLTSDFETALIKNTSWGRLGTPADIAQAALFLASPVADYVTGEVLTVNGGAFAGRMYLPLSTPKAGLSYHQPGVHEIGRGTPRGSRQECETGRAQPAYLCRFRARLCTRILCVKHPPQRSREPSANPVGDW